jgi:predicted phosphodiesterase
MFFDETLPEKVAGETRIAHLSDLHIAPIRARLADETRRFLKRPIGNNLEWTELILADAARHGVDHVVITGDLSQSGRKQQFACVREVLKDYDDPQRLSIVPGNHDVSYRDFITKGRAKPDHPAKLTGFLKAFSHVIPAQLPPEIGLTKDGVFPSVKFIGEGGSVALIGIDTTRGFSTHMPGLNSLGIVSRSQFAALREILESKALESRTKIVLMHHHPMIIPYYNWFDNLKSLMRSKQLLDLLYDRHVDLILHGHKHHPFCWQSHTFDDHNLSVICAGPPDAYANGMERPKELIYNIYALHKSSIHVHYQRCAVPGRPRGAFVFSRKRKE